MENKATEKLSQTSSFLDRVSEEGATALLANREIGKTIDIGSSENKTIVTQTELPAASTTAFAAATGGAIPKTSTIWSMDYRLEEPSTNPQQPITKYQFGNLEPLGNITEQSTEMSQHRYGSTLGKKYLREYVPTTRYELETVKVKENIQSLQKQIETLYKEINRIQPTEHIDTVIESDSNDEEQTNITPKRKKQINTVQHLQPPVSIKTNLSPNIQQCREKKIPQYLEEYLPNLPKLNVSDADSIMDFLIALYRIEILVPGYLPEIIARLALYANDPASGLALKNIITQQNVSWEVIRKQLLAQVTRREQLRLQYQRLYSYQAEGELFRSFSDRIIDAGLVLGATEDLVIELILGGAAPQTACYFTFKEIPKTYKQLENLIKNLEHQTAIEVSRKAEITNQGLFSAYKPFAQVTQSTTTPILHNGNRLGQTESNTGHVTYNICTSCTDKQNRNFPNNRNNYRYNRNNFSNNRENFNYNRSYRNNYNNFRDYNRKAYEASYRNNNNYRRDYNNNYSRNYDRQNNNNYYYDRRSRNNERGRDQSRGRDSSRSNYRSYSNNRAENNNNQQPKGNIMPILPDNMQWVAVPIENGNNKKSQSRSNTTSGRSASKNARQPSSNSQNN